MGYVCARLTGLLADARPYTGWYWLLAVTTGIVVAIAAPWASVLVARSRARWAGWPLVGYMMALAGGMRYFLLLRFTPPGRVPAVLPPPPLWVVLEIAGLSAEATTIAAITLLMLAVMAEVVAPGLVGHRVRAWRVRRAGAARNHTAAGASFLVRLRVLTPGSAAGRWLHGGIRVGPGSLLWEPATGAEAAPLELSSAVIVPGNAGTGQAVTVDTQSGRIQLDCRPGTFAQLQRLATGPDDTPREAPGDE